MKFLAIVFMVMVANVSKAEDSQFPSSWTPVGDVECTFSVTDWSKRCSGSGEEQICLGEQLTRVELKTKMYSCVPELDEYGCEGGGNAVVDQVNKKFRVAVEGRESNVEVTIGGEDFSSYLDIRDLNTMASSSMTSQFEEDGFEFVDLWAFNGSTKLGENVFCGFATKKEEPSGSAASEKSVNSRERSPRTLAPVIDHSFELAKSRAEKAARRMYSPGKGQLLALPKE